MGMPVDRPILNVPFQPLQPTTSSGQYGTVTFNADLNTYVYQGPNAEHYFTEMMTPSRGRARGRVKPAKPQPKP